MDTKSATKPAPDSVTVRHPMQIPISWGTSTQKDNLLKSLKSWAANDGYSKVEFSELGGARVYGFKEDKVLKIYFFLSNGGGPWK